MSTLGQTGDLDQYLDDPQVTQAVRSWARDEGLLVTVPVAPWRQLGGSGALLVRLHIFPSATRRRPADVLLKVCSAGSPAREPINLRRAWQDSPDFAARHLFRQLYAPAIMADGRVLMFLDSSDSLTSAVTLGQLPSAARLDGCIATTRLVLGDWNSSTTCQHRALTVQQFLRMELRGVLDRGRSAYNWAADAGLISAVAARVMAGDADDGLNDMARYFQLESGLATKVDFLAGRSHGDLHVDNVIVPCPPDGGFDFDRIRLIDLSAFDPRAPLTRDIAALLLSLIFSAVRSGALSTQGPSLVDILTSAAPRAAAHLTSLQHAVLSVRSSAIAQVETRLRELFHRQYLLSLIAQSIIYTSYRNAGDSGRRWYLLLGSAAAEAYRSSTR
jgi:hypothetical protein